MLAHNQGDPAPALSLGHWELLGTLWWLAAAPGSGHKDSESGERGQEGPWGAGLQTKLICMIYHFVSIFGL